MAHIRSVGRVVAVRHANYWRYVIIGMKSTMLSVFENFMNLRYVAVMSHNCQLLELMLFGHAYSTLSTISTLEVQPPSTLGSTTH